MLNPICFLVIFRGEKLSFVFSYGGISAATIFSIDHFNDSMDIPLHALPFKLLPLLPLPTLPSMRFGSSDLSLDAPVGLCICHSILL